jgi:protein TIF31
LVKSFENGENIPTDSESVSEIFHSQGLNVRYIGKVANQIEKGKLPHVRHSLERSMIARSAVKVFNELIKTIAPTKSSKFITHILNILFAPSHIISKLDEGEDISGEESKVHSKQSKTEHDAFAKNKQKSKKNNNKKTKNKGKTEGKGEEQKLFDIKSLYNKNFKNLVEDNKNSKLLKMKPKELYSRITHLVKKRYNYELPQNMVDLEWRKSYNNKIAFLRDFCLKLGLKVHSKDYELEETKDGQKDINVLPFTEADVAELVPMIKNFDIINYDYKIFITNAKAALREGYYEQAFEFLNQAININLQISGPINKEASSCLAQLSNIHFKFGDYNQAVQLQTKCVILSEKIYGKIHPKTAQSYANLAQITTIGNYTKAFEYMKRALYIYEVVCGDNHPEIVTTYSSLGFMFMEIDNPQSAIECFKQSLNRNISMYGQEHMQVANSYQIIASSYQNAGQFREALEFQLKSHNILVKLLGEEDNLVKNSLATIDQFTKLSVQKELFKQHDEQSKFIHNYIVDQRELGSNKKGKKPKVGLF